MDYPLISIIIPNYNNEKYITKCIKSCTVQTYKNIEIIIIDDCSSDNSVNIVKRLKEKDKRIKLIQNEVNKKVAETRHIGIKKSHGSWITTIDSDDFYYSHYKLENEINIIRNFDFNDNIISYSGIVKVDYNGTKLKNVMTAEKIREGNIFDSIITRDCAIPRDFLFSKNAYFKSGGFDFKIPIFEDWDLKIRLAKDCEYYFSGNWEGIAYRQHTSGLSSAKKEELSFWKNYVFWKNLIQYPEKRYLEQQFRNNVKSSVIKNIYKKLFK